MTRTTLEGQDCIRLTLRIHMDMHEALMTLARASGMSMNRAGTYAIHEYLLRNGRWEKIEQWLLETGQRYRADIGSIEALAGSIHGSPTD